MTFDVVTNEDFIPVAEKLIEMDQPLPNPLLPFMSFTGRNRDGSIGAMAVLSTVALIEPFYVEAEPDGGMNSARLFRFTEQYVKKNGMWRTIFHTSCPKMRKMLLRAGCKPIPEEVFELRREWM